MTQFTRRTFAASAAATPILAACQAAPPQEAQASAPPPASGTPTWRAGAEAPYAVQEIYPELYRGGIWVAGGFTRLGATERVIVYDIATNTWRDGPALPTVSHHVQLAALNDELWAIGGFLGGITRTQWICTPRVLKLNGDRWVEGPSLPKPIAEGMPLVHQGRIHLIGGRSPLGTANSDWDHQGDVDDHFVFAAGATQWERATPLPMARNSHAGATLGGTIHIISGRTVANGQTPAHHIYDARSGQWREGPAFPDARGGIAAATWRGRIVAGGGEIFQPPSVGDGLHAFDETSGWSRTETMPTPRHGHGLISDGDTLYALGGASQVSARQTLSRLDILG
jgi:hypothetical protein